jgi:hypothetical protein
MIVCRKCGRQNADGARFCAGSQCGEYLGWDTQLRTGTVVGSATVQPGHYTQNAAASVTLAATELVAAPGGTATTTATVRNGGSQVEEFTVSVIGPAAVWATVEPAKLNIYPGDRAECSVRFAPPRDPSVRPGRADFTVVATSTVHRELATGATGAVDVGTFRALNAELTPQRSTGRWRTVHRVVLTNAGNVVEPVHISASDPADRLRFALPAGEVRVPPGRQEVNVSVQPPRRWFGRPQQYPFQVTVSTPPPTAPVRLDGFRNASPLIPGWSLTLAAVLAAAAVVTVVVFALRAPSQAHQSPGTGLGPVSPGPVTGLPPSIVQPGQSNPETAPSVTVPSQPVVSPVAPPPPLPFLNRLAGDWHLQSWTEAAGPTTLYLDVRDGTMTVSGSGTADWRLDFDERGESHNPQPAIKCGGQANSGATIDAQPGGSRNSAIDWTTDLDSVDHSSTGEGFIWRAMCGWTLIGGQYPFAITLQGDPTQPATVMQMSNMYGTFVWQR